MQLLVVSPEFPIESEHPSEIFFDKWDSSRQGARAVRGFYFQEMVGAWIAAQIAVGKINTGALVPESFDDFVLEGRGLKHISVKSRVPYRGSFPIGEACKHILDAWQKVKAVPSESQSLLVVMEGGIKGIGIANEIESPLSGTFEPGSLIIDSLVEYAGERGLDSRGIDELLAATSVIGVAWEELHSETENEISKILSLPPSALRLASRHLCSLVAQATTANANRKYPTRRKLTRSEIASSLESIAEQVDVDSLEFAVSAGICEPVNFAAKSADGHGFYEGVSTQPSHVAAGLVVPNAKVIDEVMFGLEERSAVILTGPSGVGKSAALWMIPMATPGVLWYRVNRLSPSDSIHLIRLARAYNVSQDSPVGFLFDSAGTSRFDGWPQFRIDAAAVPGVLLVGSAREEDVITLGDLTDLVTVPVHLDEVTAERIYDGLVLRGATDAPHWTEALRKCRGLTLEFTHLLTKGRRLRDVAKEQIRRRIAENRHLELEVLRIATTADRWFASLTIPELVSLSGASKWQVRAAIERLANEHLLIEQNGSVSGIHQLRSAAISDEIHGRPPPSLGATIRELLNCLQPGQIHLFVANLLRDKPDERGAVFEAAKSRALDLDRILAFLHGLRILDFYAITKTWMGIANKRGIPASSQPLLVFSTAVGASLPDSTHADLQETQRVLRKVPKQSWRDELLRELGERTIARLITSEPELEKVTRAFAVLEDGGDNLANELFAALQGESELLRAAKPASTNQLAELISSASACNEDFAQTLSTEIGDQYHFFDKLRAENPWITELELRTDNGKQFVHCRFLHVSDEIQGDPQDQVMQLARNLLRCFTSTEFVDVKALAPGGQELRFGDYTHGISRLQRSFDYSTHRLAWNQVRVRAGLTLLGEPDTTRLASALPLLSELSELTFEIATEFAIGKLDSRFARLATKTSRLHKKAVKLKPPIGVIEFEVAMSNDQPPAPITDNLARLILDLTGNVFPRLRSPDEYGRVAGFISETVIKVHLEGAKNEPWGLLGIDDHPECLDRLNGHLNELYVVAKEFATEATAAARIAKTASAGARNFALRRASESCSKRIRRRGQKRLIEIRRLCRKAGITAKVYHRDQVRPIVREIAIAVELKSLSTWPEIAHQLGELLTANRPNDESYFLVPIRAGQSVPRFAMQLIYTLLASPGLGEWQATLAAPAPENLAAAFQEAHTALQVISGIAALSDDQRAHERVDHALSKSQNRLQRSRHEISEFPGDPVVNELQGIVDDLAERVSAELAGESEALNFAERFAAGLLQIEQTDEFLVIVFAQLIAQEWDINPRSACQQLA